MRILYASVCGVGVCVCTYDTVLDVYSFVPTGIRGDGTTDVAHHYDSRRLLLIPVP